MLKKFSRLLRRSKDREGPPTRTQSSPGMRNGQETNKPGASEAHGTLRLPRRARPQLTSEVARLQLQLRELQRRFKQLPTGKSNLRKSKLRASVQRLAQVAPSELAQEGGLSLPAPATAANRNRRLLASRSASRGQVVPSLQHPYRARNSFMSNKPLLEGSPLVGNASGESWAVTPEENSLLLRQAANAARMRRLRAWSQTHQQDTIKADEKFAGGKVDAVATVTQKQAPAPSGQTHGKSKAEEKAWAIMADLQLETIETNRSLKTSEEKKEASAAVSSAVSIGSSGISSLRNSRGPRRQTEPATSNKTERQASSLQWLL